MELMWIFLGFLLIAYVFLGAMATNMIRASEIHDDQRKNRLMLIIWGLPVLGVFIVTRQINRDIKENQAKMEEQIAPAIREVADRLKVLDADISRSRTGGTAVQTTGKDKKLH